MFSVNPYRRTRIRSGLVEWLRRGEFTHAVTLNFNRGDLALRSQERLFSIWCMEMDRLKRGGGKVNRLPTHERLHAIALPEKPHSNAHLHVVADLRFADERVMGDRDINQAVGKIWKKLTRGSGSSQTIRIRDGGWAWYMTKEAVRHDNVYFLAATYHAA